MDHYTVLHFAASLDLPHVQCKTKAKMIWVCILKTLILAPVEFLRLFVRKMTLF
jgi:hypothetical protein